MNNAKLFLSYHGIVRINQIYALLRRLPVLRKKLSPSPNVEMEGKQILTVLGIIYRIFSCIFNTSLIMAIYYFLWKLLPWASLYGENAHLYGFFQCFFFLNMISGPVFIRRGRQEMDWTGYYFLKVFRFPAKDFFLSRIYLNLIRLAIGQFFPVVFMGWLVGNLWMAILAYVSGLFMRLFIEAFTLWLFEKKGKTLWENAFLLIAIYLVCLVLSLLPVYGKWILYVIPGFFPLTAVGALWGFFYLKKAPYEKLSAGLSTTEELSASKVTIAAAQFLDVKMENQEIASDQPGNISHKKGYDYLHQLIFYRIQKKLDKKLHRRVIIFGAVGLLLFISGVIFRDFIAKDVRRLFLITLRMSFFISYMTSPGERFVKLLFLYMDKDLLSFPYYRQPGAILTCLKIRLWKLLKITAPTTGTILVSFLAYFSLFYEQLGTMILLLIPAFLIQGAFFALFRLMVYYLLQPYTLKMESKSISASLVNSLVYLISYVFFQIKYFEFSAIAILCAVMGVIALVAPFLLKSQGPKLFKLRES